MSTVVFLHTTWYEHLGIMILSSMLKSRGHSVDLGIFADPMEAARYAAERRPDLVAVSCTTGGHTWALDLARELRRRVDSLFVLGGPHPTYFPGVIEDPAVDVICRGEGEFALAELADAVEEGRDYTGIKNLWAKKNGTVYQNPLRPLISDLDELPFPDSGLFYRYKEIRENPVRHFMISRGCPYKCTYCFNESLMRLYKGNGRYFRLHSIDYSLQEMKHVKKTVGMKAIYFHDDTFYLNRRFYDEFLKRYKQEIDVPFICQLRADLIDEDMAVRLKSANCSTVHMGVETANESIRKNVLSKNISNQQIIDAVNLLQRYKIKVMAFNMLGIPGEKIDDAFNTIEFNRKMRVHSRFSIFTPYPNTGIYRYMKERGMIDGDLDVNMIGPTYFSNSVLTHPFYREIENLQKFSYLLVVFPQLKKLVRRMIKFPGNIAYDLLFLFTFAIHYSISNEQGFYSTLKLGLKNLKLFFWKKA